MGIFSGIDNKGTVLTCNKFFVRMYEEMIRREMKDRFKNMSSIQSLLTNNSNITISMFENKAIKALKIFHSLICNRDIIKTIITNMDFYHGVMEPEEVSFIKSISKEDFNYVNILYQIRCKSSVVRDTEINTSKALTDYLIMRSLICRVNKNLKKSINHNRFIDNCDGNICSIKENADNILTYICEMAVKR